MYLRVKEGVWGTEKQKGSENGIKKMDEIN